VDQNLVPVSPVVEEENVDPYSCRAARLVARRTRSEGPAALDSSTLRTPVEFFVHTRTFNSSRYSHGAQIILAFIVFAEVTFEALDLLLM
jgi:hypothetical protein